MKFQFETTIEYSRRLSPRLSTFGDDDARLFVHSNRILRKNRESVWKAIVEIQLFIDDFLIPRNFKKKIILIFQYSIRDFFYVYNKIAALMG